MTFSQIAKMAGPKLVKFLSSLYDSELYFPAVFASQGVSIRMLQWLDGAR
jgi:hypothetical protein